MFWVRKGCVLYFVAAKKVPWTEFCSCAPYALRFVPIKSLCTTSPPLSEPWYNSWYRRGANHPMNGENPMGIERNFGEQLSAATLGSSFREPLWRIALGNRFGEQVWSIAALGQPLCRGSLGNSFGKQLRGTALGSSQQQFWGAAFGSHFGAIDLKNRSFGAIALDSSSGEQLWGAALREQLGGSSFGQLSRTALRNTCFEEQQLSGTNLQGTSGSNFQ